MVFLASALAGAQEATPTPAPSPTPTPSAGKVILINRFGQAVSVPQADVPKSLLPPASVGIEGQLPAPVVGAKLPSELLQRMDAGRNRVFTLFPAAPARLEPYLAAQDQLGNSVIQPGALVDVVLTESVVQGAKYWPSARGLRYSISQVFTYTGVPDTPSGSPNMGYYTMKFLAKWAVYDSPDSGTAGWLSSQVNAKEGLGGAGHNQSAEFNIGSLTNPTGVFAGRNGARVPELAWQQSFAHGKFVALAGVVAQANYLDVNTYANTGRGEFLNSALINSMVLPLPSYNFAVNLQWQPSGHFYAMLGATAGNASAGQTPWTNFTWDQWAVVSEFGFMPEDFLGLGTRRLPLPAVPRAERRAGPGRHRLQLPAAARPRSRPSRGSGASAPAAHRSLRAPRRRWEPDSS